MSVLSATNFPTDCPECKSMAGMPHLAGTTTQSGSLNIQLRCRECGHEWPFKIPRTAGSRIVRKRDRRMKA